MSSGHAESIRRWPAAGDVVAASPARQAYHILHFAFFLAPLVAGIDKFLHLLVNWDQYLSPKIASLTTIPAHNLMLGVGVIEIIAAFIVAFMPKVGAWIVFLWLWAIIANLLLLPGYYDVALRDFGLSLGALALACLSRDFA